VHISDDFCFPFRFRFTPIAGATGTGSVTFITNDPAHPILIIGLTATVGAPKLDVNSTSHTFGTLCAGQTATWPLEVFNTGDCDLTITSIAPPPGVINATEFALLSDPVVPTRISPDAHVNYSITFAPTAASTPGTKHATFRVTSATGAFKDVAVTGTVGSPTMTVQGVPLNFGTVPLSIAMAPGAQQAVRQFQICNTGTCDLSVTGVALEDPDTGLASDDFAIVEGTTFPVTVSPDSCLPFHVRFTPDSCEHKHAILRIRSDDPNIPNAGTTGVTFAVDADTQCASTGDQLDVPSQLCFPTTVIQDFGNCFSDLKPAITNTGLQALKIHSLTIGGDNPECYTLIGAPVTPFILNGGAVLGSGTFKVRFQPVSVTRDCSAELDIQLEDPISGELTDVIAIPLSGEAVAPGARLLVLSKGSPAPSVFDIKLQQKQANGKFKTIEDWKGASPESVKTSCASFTFHVEVGGEDSGTLDHLDPGFYQFVVTLNGPSGSGKKKKAAGPVKTVTFKVGTCTFQQLSVRF